MLTNNELIGLIALLVFLGVQGLLQLGFIWYAMRRKDD